MKHAFATPALADTTTPQYDANGNLTSRATALGTTDYSYDALDRLKTEFGPGVDQSFGYDGNGNRQSDAANIYTLAPNGNRIQTVNGVTRIYDPAGNLLDDGQGKTYTHNAAGRLKEVRVNNVLVASYKYNYRGLRTHKITPEGTTLYHYDIQGRLVQTTDQAGVPRQSLHWAGDQPIAQVDHAPGGDKLVYLHTDHLNTPRTATDQAGTVVWRWEGGAFGETLPNEDPDGDGNLTKIDLRYAGQYYDSETGLFYNWNRYYDPKTGRYISSDPIGLRGGLNTYLYARANPLRYIDPTGLFEMYGNWGGANWSGGASGPNIPQNPRPPIDSLDACFMAHDYCYASMGSCSSKDARQKREKACDLALLQCLTNLPSNTSDWPMPAQNPVYDRNQHSPTADWWRSEAQQWFQRKWR